MADEDITLDGKPLQSLRVADLKAALEQRNLPKSGPKQTLLKRLKGALMLENLQKSSGSHSGLQPNSQIGEEMSQNSFIKQYLAQQQELLQQRLEREAQQEAGANLAMEDEDDDDDDDQSEDDLSFVPNKPTHQVRTEQMEVEESAVSLRKTLTGPDVGAGLIHRQQGSVDVPRTRTQRAALYREHKEPQAPSPPRAVASLSVRVLGQPDRQEPDSAVPHPLRKEGCTSSEPRPTYPAAHHSQAAAGVYKDMDDDADDDSKNDEDWGPCTIKKAKGAPPKVAVNIPSPAARSKRKLQPPQHIPPPQAHPAAMQHPTPPPSPPPDLFPLPDTPKQSPPDGDVDDDKKRGSHQSSGLPAALQRQSSESSSHSSSPEPPMKQGLGPLSMLVHKMEQADASARCDKAGSSGGSVFHNSEPKTQADKREGKLLARVRGEPQQEQREDRLSEKMETTRSESMERPKRRDVPGQKLVMMDGDSASSSDSDSSSSSSAGGEPCSTRQLKKVDQGRQAGDDETTRKREQKGLLRREVSEPSAATMSEADPESESAVAEQPAFTAEPVSNDAHMDEVPMPLPLPLMVPAAYYYYQHHHHHQHLLHFSYYSFNSCPAKPKCAVGT